MKERLPPAQHSKIASVEIEEMLDRERLHTLFRGKKPQKGCWISGPPGSGKTCCAASFIKSERLPALWYHVDGLDHDPATFFHYFSLAVRQHAPPASVPLPRLTAEYIPNLERFALNFFAKAFLCLPKGCWIVFDNIQVVPDDSDLVRILAIALQQLPATMGLAMLSRRDPPVVMTRMLANRTLAHIPKNELGLNREELGQLLSLFKVSSSTDTVEELYRLTAGWVAGVILWLQRSSGSSDLLPLEVTPDTICDYFLGEIVLELEEPERSFMLTSSILPFMTVEMADEFCRMQADGMLETLIKKNKFLERKLCGTTSLYQFHPLFRDCLQRMVTMEMTPEQLAEARYRAARPLERHGSPRAAIPFNGRIGAVEEVARLIMQHGEDLVKQERYTNLRSLLDLLDDELVWSRPGLCYYRALATMLTNPPQGIRYCRRAYELYTAEAELRGRIISWSMLVEMLFMDRREFNALDHWITEGSQLEPLLLKENDPDLHTRFACSMLMALVLRDLSSWEVGRWQNRCEELLHQCGDPYVRAILMGNLFWSYNWLGQVKRAMKMEAGLHMELQTVTSPLVQIILLTTLTLSHAHRADHKGCSRLADTTLELAEQHGIHVYDFMLLLYRCYLGLCTGNGGQVRPYLDRMAQLLKPQTLWDHGMYHLFCAWCDLLDGDLPASDRHLLIAEELLTRCGVPYLEAMARIIRCQYLLETGESARAGELMEQNMSDHAVLRSGNIQLLSMLALADSWFVRDEPLKAQRLLWQAFAKTRENGMPMPNGLLHRRLGELCLKALQFGMERQPIVSLIKTWDLQPGPNAEMEGCWPYRLRIFCLGRFAIESKGKVLTAAGKRQQKPLALLKLLIASGGQSVPAAALAAILWPDSDGDMQLQTFSTTLHRLRKLLDCNQAITLEAGDASLNYKLCWTDVRAFELCISDYCQHSSDIDGDNESRDRLDRIFSLYQGEFLPNEEERWVLPVREKMRRRLIEQIEATGMHYESHQEWRKAIILYRRGLSSAPSAENLLLRLMCCLRTTDRSGEAIQCYLQYRQEIAHSLQTGASSAVQKLYEELSRPC